MHSMQARPTLPSKAAPAVSYLIEQLSHKHGSCNSQTDLSKNQFRGSLNHSHFTSLNTFCVYQQLFGSVPSEFKLI